MLVSDMPAAPASSVGFLRASSTALASASSFASFAKKKDPIPGKLIRVAPVLASALNAATKRSTSVMVNELFPVTLLPINYC